MHYDRRSALIVVDMQNDFADPDGSLSVSGALEVVRAVNSEVESATRAGALVVYTQDWHPGETPHFVTSGGTWPPHCVAETWGADFHPDLVVATDAAFVREGVTGEDGYSGFTVRDEETRTEHDTVLDRL